MYRSGAQCAVDVNFNSSVGIMLSTYTACCPLNMFVHAIEKRDSTMHAKQTPLLCGRRYTLNQVWRCVGGDACHLVADATVGATGHTARTGDGRRSALLFPLVAMLTACVQLKGQDKETHRHLDSTQCRARQIECCRGHPAAGRVHFHWVHLCHTRPWEDVCATIQSVIYNCHNQTGRMT